MPVRSRSRAAPVVPADTVSAGRSAFRKDIQALRAVAVLCVVVYHVWPDAVPGGFVGVDVFFVISGYLMTLHLTSTDQHSWSTVRGFWARRVRRLLPAATLVLVATLAAAMVWMPRSALATTVREIIASALYVENWALASSEADYLDAEQTHSPVQHYWSLSVEEQFYILWPVLLLCVALWASKRSSRRAFLKGVGIVSGVLLLASFAWSVHRVGASPEAAYFETTTRVWELSLGALVAVAVRGWSGLRPSARTAGAPLTALPVRAAGAWLGTLGIVASAFLLNGESDFPGWNAIPPTLSTALVILAAADGVAGGPGAMFSRRSVQWVGKVSYALYLWHWPVIVMYPYVAGDIGVLGGVTVLLVSLLLAQLTERWVEQPFRSVKVFSSLRSSFKLLAVCVALCVSLALIVLAVLGIFNDREKEEYLRLLEESEGCLGVAVAMEAGCESPDFVTPPRIAAADKPVVYEDGCWNNSPFESRNTCTYGELSASGKRVALVGNSHAGHWLPAIEPTLENDGWQLTTYMQSVCYTVDVTIELPADGAGAGCLETNDWAVESVVNGGYDLVVMSNRTHQALRGVDEKDKNDVAKDAYGRVLARFTDAGIPVLVIRDTPAMPENVPECIDAHSGDWARCGSAASVAVEPDPLAEVGAEDRSGMVSVIDVNELICRDGYCSPVVGGLIAYFDHGHLTASFARTLASSVDGAMRSAVERS